MPSVTLVEFISFICGGLYCIYGWGAGIYLERLLPYLDRPLVAPDLFEHVLIHPDVQSWSSNSQTSEPIQDIC